MFAVPAETGYGATTADLGAYVDLPGDISEAGLALCPTTIGDDELVVNLPTEGLLFFDGASVNGALSEVDGDSELKTTSQVLVNCVSDLTGDGVADLVVSVLVPAGTESDYSTYVISDWPPANGATLAASASVVVESGTAADIGFGVSSDSGDLDDDGHRDLVVGAFVASSADFGGSTRATDSGCAAVFYGAFAPGTRVANDAQSAVFCSQTTAALLGVSVAASSDLTGDGVDDLVLPTLELAPDGVDIGVTHIIPGLTN